MTSTACICEYLCIPAYQEKKKQVLKGETERTKTDKLRARRAKKKLQGEKQKRRLEREARLVATGGTLGQATARRQAMDDLTKQSKRGKGVTVIQVRGDDDAPPVSACANQYCQFINLLLQRTQ